MAAVVVLVLGVGAFFLFSGGGGGLGGGYVDVPSGSDWGTFTVAVTVKIGSRNNTRSVTYDLAQENGKSAAS